MSNPEPLVTYDDVGRIYNIDDHKLYSVTTMLSYISDHSFLEKWKERTPDHERIKAQAAQLGTDFHLLGEYYLKGASLPTVQWFAEKMFSFVIPRLENITETIETEKFLYDKGIRLAGRTDAVVIWKDKLAILDFKCLNHTKKEYLNDYWIQTCIYAFMYYSMTGERPEKLVLVCGDKKKMSGIVYEEDFNKYAKEASEKIKIFHKKLKEMEKQHE